MSWGVFPFVCSSELWAEKFGNRGDRGPTQEIRVRWQVMWISLKKIWWHFLETSKCRSKWVINYEPLTLVIKQLRPIRQCICGRLELGLVESETCCWRLSVFHHLRDVLITWSSSTCWIWLLIWNGIYTLKWGISVRAERAPESKWVIQQGQAVSRCNILTQHSICWRVTSVLLSGGTDGRDAPNNHDIPWASCQM